LLVAGFKEIGLFITLYNGVGQTRHPEVHVEEDVLLETIKVVNNLHLLLE
jgi:hypothetical protein